MLLVRYAIDAHGNGKYRLEWAVCLSDGLSRLLKGGVDVVLLDLGLPDSSGSVSYAWVREAARDVPVVVLTGDTREETELTVFSSGVDDYLVKEQVSGPGLISAIQQAINKEAGRQYLKDHYSTNSNWRPSAELD
jgi:DNA-binding response OmpR family regulator